MSEERKKEEEGGMNEGIGGTKEGLEGNKEELKDKEGENARIDYEKKTKQGEIALKVICLGDSAVGKSK